MQLIICDNDEVPYEWFKNLVKHWLQSRDHNTPLNIILRCGSYTVASQAVLNYIAKLVGLIITDGLLSRILRQRELRSVTFRGLNLDTLYSVFYSALKLSRRIKINISKQNTAKMGKPYFDINLYLHENLRNEVLHLIQNVLTESTSLSVLPEDAKAALFAGLIDGDGYIGKTKKHIIIAYKKDSLKGRSIDYILNYLAFQGFITLGKYRGKPHYERYVRLINLDFARCVCKYVYHPRRHEELEDLMRGLIRNYKCRYTINEIKAQIMRAISAYIDFRRSEKGRRIPVLVIYTRSKEGRRVSIKITAKCLKELEVCVNDHDIKLKTNNNVLNTILHYLQLLKSL